MNLSDYHLAYCLHLKDGNFPPVLWALELVEDGRLHDKSVNVSGDHEIIRANRCLS